MSSIANIVAFDGASTPASHTFTGISSEKDKGVSIAIHRELLSTVPEAAQCRITTKVSRLSDKVVRKSVRVEVPVQEATDGANSAGYTAAPKVAYTDAFEVVQFCHERSTLEGRRLARQLMTNVLNGVVTSVTPVTTHMVAELFDSGIFPS